MKKSKYVYLILFVVYMVIALASSCSILSINENVLLGLSIASLFMSLSDMFSNIIQIMLEKNEYNYSLFITSEFLQQKIQAGFITANCIDVCNIKYNIDALMSTKNPTYPNTYNKKRGFLFLHIFSVIFLVLAISCFIGFPFLTISNNNLAKYVTIVAFAFVCLNLYLNEVEYEIKVNEHSLKNDKQSLIRVLFPDFDSYYFGKTEHEDNYQKAQELMTNNSLPQNDKMP